MKIFAVTSADDTSSEYYLIADSALTPWRKPFFLPDWDSDFMLYFSPAIYICRLGKSIPERYAHRYYIHAAWGWTARAGNLYEKLAEEGRPVSAAVSFDNAAFVGEKVDFANITDQLAEGVTIRQNGENVMTCKVETLAPVVNAAIARLSSHDTLKTGDIIYPIIPETGIRIKEGDRIEITDANGQTIHNFTVK